MSLTFPPTFTAHIANLIRSYGEDVRFIPSATGVSTNPFRAAVQGPFADNLVNDADQAAMTVYVSGLDLAGPVLKFDRLFVRGFDRAIEDAQEIVANGVIQAWVLKVKG